MKQLATVHVPASTAEDLNLDYREHPEDLNLGSLKKVQQPAVLSDPLPDP